MDPTIPLCHPLQQEHRPRPHPGDPRCPTPAPPWYHVISRCVRRAFLCGEDLATGRNFEHRRGWIVARMEQLAGVFAVDVAAYAVMSNHFHQVVRVDAERARAWSHDEVLRRWTKLYTGPELVQQYLRDGGAGLGNAQLEAVQGWAATYRARLGDLSWYMRVLNESISRMANAEDGVTGRFWEGRFKSHALLDEAAVLTAMAYVDLNPIRARLATVPEDSAFTSIAERLQKAGEAEDESAVSAADAAAPAAEPLPTHPLESHLSALPRAPLMPFDATGRMAAAIPFAFDDYLELVDSTGRVIREDKRGYIPGETPRVLERLNIDPEQFIATTARMLDLFSTAIGTPEHLTAHCVARNVAFLRGMGAARALFERKAA
jgi:hypothetical protein